MTTYQFDPSFDVQLKCAKCQSNLAGHRYVLHESRPFCVRCYEADFSHNCMLCQKLIGTDHKELAYREMFWHDHCFYCSNCKTNLVEKPFAFKDDKLFCPSCYEKLNGTKCDGCGQTFKAGQKKYEYSGKQWHEECFKCKNCETFIGANAFIPYDGLPICVPCFEQNYAMRCNKCKKVINKGGVKCKDIPWHKECFVCTHCNKSLLNEKYTTKESMPYCMSCYAELYAKKCVRCDKAITGVGGGKFISFEDRNWHSDCFNCYKCNDNLVGKGFLTNGNEILCPNCGKK